MCKQYYVWILSWFGLSLFSVQSQKPMGTIHELHTAALRCFAIGDDQCAAEYSRLVLQQQPNHCASGTLIIKSAIRGGFFRTELIRMSQQLMANGCREFQSYANQVLALLYNDRAKEAGFALEQIHRRFPHHPEIDELEAELALGLRRFDPFIEGLTKLTQPRPDPEKVSFALRRLDRMSDYFLGEDSSRAEETLSRLLIRHTARQEGKVLYAIWSRFRKQDTKPLTLYFAEYPQELSLQPPHYLALVHLQDLMQTQPATGLALLKKWLQNPSATENTLLLSFLERKHLNIHSSNNNLPWNAPKLTSWLEPAFAFPHPPFPLWFWDWTDSISLAHTLLKTIPGKTQTATVPDLLTAYEFCMRQDSTNKNHLSALLKKQCETHPIFLRKMHRKKSGMVDSVRIFVMVHRALRTLHPDRRSSVFGKTGEKSPVSEQDSISSVVFLHQLLGKGRLWAASGLLRLTNLPSSTSTEQAAVNDLLQLLTRTQWGDSQGYLPGYTEAALVQRTRKNLTDSVWTRPLDSLTAVFGFSSLIPTP